MTPNRPFGGPWTQQKLEILGRYLDAYTTALKDQRFTLTYIDAFAGPGSYHAGSSSEMEEYSEFNEVLRGSPKIALEVNDKPFDRLVFIDTQPAHIESLRTLKTENPERNIQIINDDANNAIPEICRSIGSFDRAVVFLDPYATQVDWSTVESIADTRNIDCWILFPRMAITRLMPLDHEPDSALAMQLDRIFGGRGHWHNVYSRAQQPSLWSQGCERERESGNAQIANAYRARLEEVFYEVSPLDRELKNSRNSTLFDLFFAVTNPRGACVAMRIANHILNRW